MLSTESNKRLYYDYTVLNVKRKKDKVDVLIYQID